MKRYVSIGTLRKLLVRHYQSFHEKVSFKNILTEAIIKEQYSTSASFSPARTNRIMALQELNNMIDGTQLEADAVLENPNANAILEDHIISKGRDIGTVCHLPYVNDQMHQHDHFEINYVYSGQASLTLNDTEHILHTGELYIITPEVQHNLMVESNDSIVIGIVVRRSTFNTIFGNFLLQDDFLPKYFCNTLYNGRQSDYLKFHVNQQDDVFRKLIQEIWSETHSHARCANLIANCLVEQMFCMLMRKYSDTVIYYGDSDLMEAQNNFLMILEYTQKHYDTVNLDILSSFFNYSKSYLSRMFKERMGMNFNTLLTQCRIKHAEELLINSKNSIAEIAEMVGYSSVDYFTKVFKKQNGFTPSVYRQKNK